MAKATCNASVQFRVRDGLTLQRLRRHRLCLATCQAGVDKFLPPVEMTVASAQAEHQSNIPFVADSNLHLTVHCAWCTIPEKVTVTDWPRKTLVVTCPIAGAYHVT